MNNLLILFFVLSYNLCLCQKIDDNNICASIYKDIDDFTGDIKYSLPYILDNSETQISPISIYKFINGNSISYYLDLRITSKNYYSINSSEVYLMLEDKEILKIDNKIDVNYYNNHYSYSTFIDLSYSLLQKIINKKIIKFRLDYYDNEVEQIVSERFNKLVSCIIKL